MSDKSGNYNNGMRSELIKIVVIFSIICSISTYTANAQRSRQGNLTGAGGAGGAGGTVRLRERGNLLPFVMSGVGSPSGTERQFFQVGVISALPSFISRISTENITAYSLSDQITRPTFNTSKTYINSDAVFLVPLEIDSEDMVPNLATWFNYRGINAIKPTMTSGLSYDTNSSNLPTDNVEPNLAHTTNLQIPFTYGDSPGSATAVNVVYQPNYRHQLMGEEEDELNHVLIVQTGRAFHRSALGLNNFTSISSTPVRELSGRARILSNTTTLRGIYDVSPKTVIRFEAGHAITTRSGDRLTPRQSIINDDVRFTVEYPISPKISIQPNGLVGLTQVANDQVRTENIGLGLNYVPTGKLNFGVVTGHVVRHPPNQVKEASQSFGFTGVYSPTVKTALKFTLSRDIRPSFADEGIFLQEDAAIFQIDQAIFLRWRVLFRLDYAQRREDDRTVADGLRQEDFGYSLRATYFLNMRTTLTYSASTFRLNDLRSGAQTQRLNFGFTLGYSF